MNFRTGPGTGYAAITTLTVNTPALAMGRSAAMDWVLVRIGEQDGWVYYTYIELTSGYLSQLPISDATTTPGGAPTTTAEGETPARVRLGSRAGLRWTGPGRFWLWRPRRQLRLS